MKNLLLNFKLEKETLNKRIYHKENFISSLNESLQKEKIPIVIYKNFEKLEISEIIGFVSDFNILEDGSVKLKADINKNYNFDIITSNIEGHTNYETREVNIDKFISFSPVDKKSIVIENIDNIKEKQFEFTFEGENNEN